MICIPEVVINSFSSTLRFENIIRESRRVYISLILCSFNQVDLQNMMDHTKEKRSHQSKFVKLLCYYIIVVTLQIRLCVWGIFLENNVIFLV